MKLDDILALPTETHDLVQGTPQWDAFRATHFGASEAAVMLGLSKKASRNDLLRVKKTGIAREFSDFVQRILDDGHEVEAKARPIIEERIGEDLYPATLSRGPLSASCDGITLANTRVLEHKQWAEALAASVRAGVLPDEHQPQCQQIMLVTGAESVLFVVSDGTEDKMESVTVYPDREWWGRIVAGWSQFEADLAEYIPSNEPAPEKIVAEPVEALPAPVVQVSGQLTLQDNFKVFETKLRDFLDHRLIRQPKTDEDFVNLDAQIKAMKQAREALKAAEAQMLAQVAPVDQAKKTKDMLDKLLQQNVSMAEQLLNAEKDRRKGEIVAGGVAALKGHVEHLNKRLAGNYIASVAADFGGVIKGLKSLASMEDKVSTELARAKIAANEIADRISVNLAMLGEQLEFAHLFPDTAALVLKSEDDCRATIQARIAKHQAEEKRRAEAAAERERERIRREEQERADREAREKLRREQENAASTAAAQALALSRERETLSPELQGQLENVAADLTADLTVARVADATKPNVVQLQKKAAPTLRIGEIASRLGFGITEQFLRQLGFAPASKQGAACLFQEEQFYLICEALIAHVRTAQAKQHEQVAA